MASLHLDQAAGLRRIMASNRPRIISILSALGHSEGSVHESHRILGNLAASLAQAGHQAHIVYGRDSDLDSLKFYGLLHTPALFEIMQTEKPLEHAISTVRDAFSASWLGCPREMHSGPASQLGVCIEALANAHDVVLVETQVSARHHLNLPILNNSAVIIQMNEKLASVKEAYSLIKQLHQSLGKRDFGILVHGNTGINASQVFNKVATVAKRFLGLELEYMGHIPMDESPNQTQKLRKKVFRAMPDSGIATLYREVASRLLAQPPAYAALDTHPMI
jgi:flagellar biosynthesis protein FlhG